jgi:hypothetical protein
MLGVLVVAVVLPTPAFAQRTSHPQVSDLLTNPVFFGEELSFGLLADGVVRPDGSVCVLDSSNMQVACLSAAGTLLWRVGRPGQGPGEYQLCVRLGALHDGGLLVLDKVGDIVTRLDRNGKYLTRFSLELSFQQVNGLLSVSEDRFVVSGYASRRGVAGDSGFHLFSPRGKLLRSLGPLPEVADQEMLRYWGTGALSATRGGMILYLPKSPYTIHSYSLESPRYLQITPRLKGPTTKPAPFVFLKSLSRTVVQASAEPVDATVQVIELRRGVFLAERARTVSGRPTRAWFDLVNDKGELIDSTELPAHLVDLRVFGLSPDGRYLWAAGTDHDRPVVWRFVVPDGLGGRR